MRRGLTLPPKQKKAGASTPPLTPSKGRGIKKAARLSLAASHIRKLNGKAEPYRTAASIKPATVLLDDRAGADSIDANPSLYQPFDVERHALRFGLANELGIYLENFQFHDLFHRQVGQTFVANLGNKRRRNFKDAHLDEVFELVFFKPHLRRLTNKLRVNFEDTCLHQLFHSQVWEAGALHFTHVR